MREASSSPLEHQRPVSSFGTDGLMRSEVHLTSQTAPDGSRSVNELAPWVCRLQDRLQKAENREAFCEASSRKRAAKMLFCGAVSGFLGFLFALIIGIITEQTSGKVDLNGVPFASGRGYFPATVSEMVHDPQKPAGKTFFAFCFVGALLIFFSKYPSHLRNVYIGDDAKGCFGVSWVSYRQFIPAPGMMLLSIVTTTPGPQAGVTDQICIMLHLVGACMLFVGYFLAEAHCLGISCFKGKVRHTVLETRHGLRQRRICLTLIAAFYMLFLVLQVVLVVREPFFSEEDDDQWGHLKGHEGIQLLNSAHWSVKFFKVVSYGSEVICGMALIASHLVIWYHCEERHYDLPEELDTLVSRLDVIPNQTAQQLRKQRTVTAGSSAGSGTSASDSDSERSGEEEDRFR